jgi:hypothetical protein
MAINWKLRETVLRLLAAVYAEFGEEGVSVAPAYLYWSRALIERQFKGRYGRIAQLFGPDAAYEWDTASKRERRVKI